MRKGQEVGQERIGIDMFEFLIGLGFLTFMLWLGFKLTGALLSACIWAFIKVPLGFCAWGIGLVLCCTIILIPVGLWFFKIGFKLLIPGV